MRTRTPTTLLLFGLGVGLSACSAESGSDEEGESTITTSSGTPSSEGSTSGPGDGDAESATGDGDAGATTAVGDGDGDGSGEGDGDSSGDGDGGDGDTSGNTSSGGDGDWSPNPASTTHYTPIDDGRCGFQTIPSGSSPHGRIAALPTWLFADADWCGAFIEIDSSTADTFKSCGGVTGETVTVMVSDECPVATNQEHCYDGAWHFDLSQTAFSDLADLSCGVIDDASWRIIEGTHAGNVKVRNKDGINQWWYSLYVLDHNYAITQVEIRPSGGDWTDAARSDTNFWNIESAAGLEVPMDVRITDIHGQVITADDVVTNLNEYSEFDVGSQFPGGMGGGGTLGP